MAFKFDLTRPHVSFCICVSFPSLSIIPHKFFFPQKRFHIGRGLPIYFFFFFPSKPVTTMFIRKKKKKSHNQTITAFVINHISNPQYMTMSMWGMSSTASSLSMWHSSIPFALLFFLRSHILLLLAPILLTLFLRTLLFFSIILLAFKLVTLRPFTLRYNSFKSALFCFHHFVIFSLWRCCRMWSRPLHVMIYIWFSAFYLLSGRTCAQYV